MNPLPAPVLPSGIPAFRLLSNGRYQVLAHGGGCSFSRFGRWALNDWLWDGLAGYGGVQLYVQEQAAGRVQRVDLGAAPDAGIPWHGTDDALHWQYSIGDMLLDLSLTLAADQPLEQRTLTLRLPAGCARRELTLTLFMPLALNDPAVHESHPAFSKLFVQTAFDAASGTLIAQRRPRGSDDPSPCLMARLDGPGELDWDTDRIRFLGRGCTPDLPAGLLDGLARRADNVLDPCFVLQRRFTLHAGEAQTFRWQLGAAENRHALEQLMALDLSCLAPVSVAGGRAELDGLLGAMHFRLPQLKPAASCRESLCAAPGNVWGYGMPTDRPFILLLTDAQAEVDWAAAAAQYWRQQGLPVPVLVLAHDRPLQATGDLVLRDAAQVPMLDRQALLAAAALVCGNRAPAAVPPRQKSGPMPALDSAPLKAGDLPLPTLQCDNGYGGFSADGREYVVRVRATKNRLHQPPMPWINVLANPGFGALVSETGAGCTWSVNSRERRLTHWANDPVRDTHEEAFYLQDGATGNVWSPVAGPRLAGVDQEARHGLGYSRFTQICEELHQQVQVFVHCHLPVKIWRIVLRNLQSRPRRFTLTACQRLVLGFLPQQTAGLLCTAQRPRQRLLLARNPLAGVLATRSAFASVVGGTHWRATCNRHALLGDAGDPAQPLGLNAAWDQTLAGNESSAPTDAFIQQVTLELPANGECAVSFLLGDGNDDAHIQHILQSLSADADIVAALEAVKTFWQEQVGGIQVNTPSQPVNLMLNGWLLYQTLVCRLWGRTAFYQSSGAYGFRDQLQDAGAFALTHPAITRAQILRHAARQFVEGDVQHWWHEAPLDAGLRTRFSDDLNWLPYITAHYLKTTGDTRILDVNVPFLQGRLLQPGEDEAYEQARVADETASLYEHCCRALDRSLTQGAHGLPLMGTGDWNDGMNRVGREGKGESVWMGFFLYRILADFIPLAEQRGEALRARQYRDYRDHLRTALNDTGWDGQWYRRAYYDNGDPLGSAANDECRIDALAQAWAVLSGVAPAEQAQQAMAATELHLIDREAGLIRLLTPAFANTPNDPGYIKGYVAGVRENGGQYTHAATWVVKALAVLERRDCVAALYEMLLPVSHGLTPDAVARFQVEPYVATADVYGEPPHVGRGGWSWYTGTSGWLYRVGVESVLGLSLRGGDTLVLKPCIPPEWPGFDLSYRLPQGGTVQVQVGRRAGGTGNRVTELYWNDQPLPPTDGAAHIRIDKRESDHRLRVLLG